jgi:hypothetical protein
VVLQDGAHPEIGASAKRLLAAILAWFTAETVANAQMSTPHTASRGLWQRSLVSLANTRLRFSSAAIRRGWFNRKSRALAKAHLWKSWRHRRLASWQKGGIENANGRLRRWLPRHLDIDRTSDQDIQEIVRTTNLTPRKCLGFKTPFQALIAELGKDIQIRFS